MLLKRRCGQCDEDRWQQRAIRHSPENVVTQELKEATNALPDDGGAEVTHVHLLGDVWRGEVHHHLDTHTDENKPLKKNLYH